MNIISNSWVLFIFLIGDFLVNDAITIKVLENWNENQGSNLQKNLTPTQLLFSEHSLFTLSELKLMRISCESIYTDSKLWLIIIFLLLII